MILFETDPQDQGYNGFLYSLGIGSGEIAKMQSGETHTMESQELPDLT